MKDWKIILGVILAAFVVGFATSAVKAVHNKDEAIERLRKDSVDTHKTNVLLNTKLMEADTLHEYCIRF